MTHQHIVPLCDRAEDDRDPAKHKFHFLFPFYEVRIKSRYALFKIPHPLQSTTPPAPKYHTTLFKVTHHLFKVPTCPLRSTTQPSLKYHTTIFKDQHQHFYSTTSPSSKYHVTLYKVPQHPLHASSKYHITIFIVTHHPLQGTTAPSSKYHITLFKVPHHLLQSTPPPLQSTTFIYYSVGFVRCVFITTMPF